MVHGGITACMLRPHCAKSHLTLHLFSPPAAPPDKAVSDVLVIISQLARLKLVRR